VVVYHSIDREVSREIPAAAPIVPQVLLDPEEQRAVLELAERSATLTKERFEELSELPTPLVGRLDGARAAARMVVIANYLSGRQ
jgi:hypothetical protein